MDINLVSFDILEPTSTMAAAVRASNSSPSRVTARMPSPDTLRASLPFSVSMVSPNMNSLTPSYSGAHFTRSANRPRMPLPRTILRLCGGAPLARYHPGLWQPV